MRQPAAPAKRFADNFAYEPVASPERWGAIGLASALTAITLTIVPFAKIALTPLPNVLLVVEAFAIVALLLSASMFSAQYRARRYAPMGVIANAFLISGLTHALYIVTFPGVFSPAGLLHAGAQTAAWAYVAARLAFCGWIGAFVASEIAQRRGRRWRRRTIRRITAANVFGFLVLVLVLTAGRDVLPAIVNVHGRYTALYVDVLQPMLMLAPLAAAIGVTALGLTRVRLGAWLGVTMLAMLLEAFASGSLGGGRFTLGWYMARVDLAASSLVFVLAMQVQLASILNRAARASTRAHTLFETYSKDADGLRASVSELLLEAMHELQFEWAFLARFEDGEPTIEISVGAEPPRSQHAPRIESSLPQALTGRDLFVTENRIVDNTTSLSWAAFASVPLFVDGALYGCVGLVNRRPRRARINDADEDFIHLVGILTVAAIERDRRAKRLSVLAYSDSLTGLANRTSLMERIKEQIAISQRHGTQFAVHFLDLDHFKPINDRFGHAVGDEVLRQVARRLRETVREGDTVARMGGDEFVVVQRIRTESREAVQLAERIDQAFSDPISTSAGTMSIGVSSGSALYPNDGSDARELLAGADEAQYRSKNRRRTLANARRKSAAPNVVNLPVRDAG